MPAQQTTLLDPAPVPARTVVRVAVPRPLHGAYDYTVPAGTPEPQPGARVRVPFGHTTAIGICVATDVEPSVDRLKDLLEVVDDEAFLPADLLALATWMSAYYHHPIGEVLATLLPVMARKGRSAQIDAPDFWRPTSQPFDNPRARKQQALYDALRERAPLSGEEIVAAGYSRQVLRNLHEGGFVEPCAPDAAHIPETPPDANPHQQAAIDAVDAVSGSFRVFLLDGVTGSGKTEVYLQTMAPVLAAGRQVLVLVPEIALTPQTLARFERRFPGVGMLHSNLGDAARLQTWLKCRHGQTRVLIGTRSAVFTPFADLGLIVIDEEHDSSYKQQEGLRYSARDTAIKRAQEANVPVILGSATPALESLHNVSRGRYQALALPDRAGGASMPSFNVIDMRGQTHTDGISVPLEHIIRRHLADAGQVLVYLNRRGFAPAVVCTACGWQACCSSCDARLTLHRAAHRQPEHLVCHHCTQRARVPEVCEGCGQKSLLPVGLGTQRTEAGLAALTGGEYPVYRVDRDSMRSNSALEATLARINTGDPCLMVGTQMLAKGHHFPAVTLVAVINADAGFLSPDFRAPERTAQMIVQVAGRAGRASRPGEVWIQTWQPDNPTLQSLINEGYPGFARQELEHRQLAGMPPTRPMAMLRADAENPTDGLELLQKLSQQLKTAAPSLEVLGPVPAPMARVANRTRYQLMLLANSRPVLHQALDRLRTDAHSRHIRFSVDVDPYDSF